VLRRTRTKALATNSELEFEFYLAEKLGMPVARLRSEVDQSEFVHWAMYYARIAQTRELAQQSGR
jgi:hypothetical protein